MKLINEMIVQKSDGNYYMREIFCSTQTCSNYGIKKVIPIKERASRCFGCKRIMGQRWINLGSKYDVSQYFSKRSEKYIKRGKNMRY